MPTMQLDDFEQKLQLHGCTLERWPEQQQSAAQRLLEQSADAQRLLADYRSLELALDELPAPDLDLAALKRRILAADLPEQPRSLIERALVWLLPHGDSPLQLFRPLSAACLPLLAGILFGNYFSFGVEQDVLALETWEDEFTLLALFELPDPDSSEQAGGLQP